MKPKIITEPNISLLNFVLLTLATVGVYPFIWLALNLEKLNEVVPEKTIKLRDIVIVAAMWAWSQRLNGADSYETQIVFGIIAIALLIAIPIYQFLRIVKPFVDGLEQRLREEYRFDLRPNKVFAFVFGYLYIVYTVNQVPKLIARATPISGSAAVAPEHDGNPPRI